MRAWSIWRVRSVRASVSARVSELTLFRFPIVFLPEKFKDLRHFSSDVKQRRKHSLGTRVDCYGLFGRRSAMPAVQLLSPSARSLEVDAIYRRGIKLVSA